MDRNAGGAERWLGLILCAWVSVGLRAQAGTMPPFVIAGSPTIPEQALSAAFDGTNYLVALQGNQVSDAGISVQLVSQTGTLLSRTNLPGAGGTPRVGFGGGRFLVVWEDDAIPTSDDVRGQIINTSGGLVGPAFTICSATGVQSPAGGALPFDGANFLVIWEDRRTGGRDIYGRLVSPAGALMSAEIPIATSTHTTRDSCAGFDGNNFLIAYSGRGGYAVDVYGQFVSRSGALIGSAFVIDQNEFPSDNGSAVIFDGSQYAVLFHDQMTNRASEDWDIYARQVSPSGIVGTNRVSIAAAVDVEEHFPCVAFDGSSILVTVLIGWFESNACVRGRYLDANLSPATPWFTVLEALGPNAFPFYGNPCYGRGKHLVVVPTAANDGSSLDVHGVFVDKRLPEFTQLRLGVGAVTLAVTNLFRGGSNSLERSFSLGRGTWEPSGGFVSGGPATNWSGIASNEWRRVFYRLQWQ